MNVLLSFGPPVKGCLQDIWPRLPHLEWLHSTTAGVEHIMFPELRDGPVTLTNAKVLYNSIQSCSVIKSAHFCLLPGLS